MIEGVVALDHAILSTRLATLRSVATPPSIFRAITRQIGALLAWEMTRDLPTRLVEVQTPLELMGIEAADEERIVLVSILRAGNVLVDGMLDALPAARVGHLGLARDPATLEAREYYAKLPERLEGCDVLVADPMLATANSAIAAIDTIKAAAPTRTIRFGCLLAAPEGLRALRAAHPDVHIWAAAVDRELNDHGYILPGLGDAGDRLYGTR
jgi:uracil phosphoribosyltransferase